jgi:hypothetical protein
MRKFSTLAFVTLFAMAIGSATAQEGGYKDTHTGKVWSQSQTTMTGYIYDWVSSNGAALNYSVWDLNAQGQMTLYDDWRLPTVSELQAALADGTIQAINNNNGFYSNTSYLFWTGEQRGNKAWAMRITLTTPDIS